MLSLRWLRPAFWLIALILGASDAWVLRHETLSDGVSYVEIATQYVGGHWWQALNAYWSPWFSWMIALAFAALRPSVYWQLATMRLTIFFAYVLSLGAFDWLMAEMHFRFRQQDTASDNQTISYLAFYIAGWCGFLFAALACVGFFFPSPDMFGLLFVLLLAALLLRMQRVGSSFTLNALVGVLCGVSFLNRTAFVPIFAVCAGVAAVLAIQRQRQGLRTRALRAALTVLGVGAACILPFVVSLSLREHRLTLGDSGRLNYSWELDGAHRWVHWQGEPGDIGKPLHPTTLALGSPKTFVFAQPIDSSYPPWYAPAYWYAGVRPRIHVFLQLKTILVNLSVFVMLFFRSPVAPVTIPLLLLFTPWRKWLHRLVVYWAVLTPSMLTIALYSLVYMEKRYIAGNLLLFWLVTIALLQPRNELLRKICTFLVPVAALLIMGSYAVTRIARPMRQTAAELYRRQEYRRNVHFLLASHLRQDGLCPGAKVAFIGPGINAEWAREGDYRIVAEVPMMYARQSSLLNNTHIEDLTQIRAFFALDQAGREKVFDAMRSAGAQMVVTDGLFEGGKDSDWPRILPEDEDRIPHFDPHVYSQINSRYQWLVPPPKSCAASSEK